jgi:YesN/AraC family two-component response regulator
MRSYLRDCLQAKYHLLEAANGEAGLRQAVEKIPDLIISDVMMPKMDGFKLCTRLKTDLRTSHIPVILLTARADDYLVKPFVARELLVRINNLIEQRRKLREHFSRESGIAINQLASTSADQKFLQRILTTIMEHISDPQFKLEKLAKEIGMSRMTMHRKIQGIFGQSPGSFVRTIRLKCGAELLKNRSDNISQIAYEVGFESPSNFSSGFRRQFGMSPSEYCKSLQNNPPVTN